MTSLEHQAFAVDLAESVVHETDKQPTVVVGLRVS